MPTINFVASYNVAKLFGAKVFLADVDKNTGQMSPQNVEDCCKKFKIKKIKPKPVIGELLAEEIGEDESAYTAYVTSMTIMIADFAQIIQDLLKED